MKLFLDFEFTGLHKYTTPISIGIVAENGKEFYAEFTDYDKDQIVGWVADNVFPNTLYLQMPINKRQHIELPKDHIWGDTALVAMKLHQWIRQFAYIEVWGDCLAYDWVLFCQLFGGALNLPRNIYYIPFDICTLFKCKGIDPDIDRAGFIEDGDIKLRDYDLYALPGKSVSAHNSLVDARMLKACYERLITL